MSPFDSLLLSRKRLVCLPLVVLHFVIRSFSLPFASRRDPTWISDWNVSSSQGLGGPSGGGSYHCWKPLRSAAPRPRISHSPDFGFHLSFAFPAFFFRDIGRLRASRCLTGVLLRYALPVGCSLLFSIQCPHCVRKSASSISLRNVIYQSLSLGICLLSHWFHIEKRCSLLS